MVKFQGKVERIGFAAQNDPEEVGGAWKKPGEAGWQTWCAGYSLVVLLRHVPYFGGVTTVADVHGSEVKVLLPGEITDMDPASAQRIEKMKQRASTKSLILANIPIDALHGAQIRVALPDGKTISLDKKSIEVRDAADFTWFGSRSGGSGSATLVVHNANITGTIRDDGRLYRIEPVGNGIHAIIEVDESRFRPD